MIIRLRRRVVTEFGLVGTTTNGVIKAFDGSTHDGKSRRLVEGWADEDIESK